MIVMQNDSFPWCTLYSAPTATPRLYHCLYCHLQLADIRAGADRSSDELEYSRSELRNARIRLDELTTEVDKLSSQVSCLSTHVDMP